MNSMATDNTKKILEMIKANLESDYVWFMDQFKIASENEKYKDHKEVLENILDWEINDNLLLYRVFGNVFVYGTSWFCQLNTFAANYLFGSSHFTIEWRKTELDETGAPVWSENEYVNTILTTKEDPNSFPEVVLPADGISGDTQDVGLLLEAMKIAKERELV